MEVIIDLKDTATLRRVMAGEDVIANTDFTTGSLRSLGIAWRAVMWPAELEPRLRERGWPYRTCGAKVIITTPQT